MKYFVDSNQKVFQNQLRAFMKDTGWVGIFKKNLHDAKTIVGEESLGVTRSGQLVKIRFDGKKFEVEN